MGKKYLILGGSGFIGANLCKYLAYHKNDVTSFDQKSPVYRQKNIKYIQGNFFNDQLLKELVSTHDIIYHAISTINPENSNKKYFEGYSKDFLQTVKLCSWSVGTGNRIVFLSSGGTVYGNQSLQPISESALPQPINHYGNVKLCIENALKIFDYQDGVKICIARISNPYGPGQDYTKGVGFIDAVLKHSLMDEVTELWGDGEIVRDYIYIDDVCTLLYTLGNYMGEEKVFNISSGKGISQKQVIKEVEELGLRVKLIIKENRNIDVQKIVLDNSKIMKICNMNIMDFKSGIRNTYELLTSTFKIN